MVVLLYEKLFTEVQWLDLNQERRFKQTMVESVGWRQSDPLNA
jgi:hypothetical protein